MYQIFFDEYPIYDPRDEKFTIRMSDVHLAVGEAGSVAFTIDSDHPYAGQLTKIKGIVTLKADGLSIFKGRIRKDTRGFNLSKEIEVEGLLACLNDSIIPPFDFPNDWAGDADYNAAAATGNVVEFFLEWLLDQHNSQVGVAQQITLGTVTVTDPNNYISRASSDYSTTMEVVRQKLERTLGGYLLADYSGDTPILHYYADLPLVNIQEVEYGENLLDLVQEVDAADTYTAIFPVGADGLTILSLPDGEISPGYIKAGNIIYSQSAEETYGSRIIRRVKWDDVTVAENLRTKALERLITEGIMLAQTITVKAVDLGGEDISRFMVGRYVRLKSSPHGFSAVYPLTELEPNILDPGDTNITLGEKRRSMIDTNATEKNSFAQEVGRLELDFNKKIENIDDFSEDLDLIRQEITNSYTKATQTAQDIVFEAVSEYTKTSDFETFKNSMTTLFEQNSEAFLMTFQTLQERVKNVEGDMQSEFTEIKKYIRFVNGSIVLGEEGNQIVLTIENDRISFSQNNVEVCYISNAKMGIREVQITERANIVGLDIYCASNGSICIN